MEVVAMVAAARVAEERVTVVVGELEEVVWLLSSV